MQLFLWLCCEISESEVIRRILFGRQAESKKNYHEEQKQFLWMKR
jgi:hypothetical protein